MILSVIPARCSNKHIQKELSINFKIFSKSTHNEINLEQYNLVLITVLIQLMAK